MRTLVDIGDKEIRALDQLATEQKVSRAALIRQAVKELLARKTQETSGDAFGLWGKSAKDGLSYQQELREEW